MSDTKKDQLLIDKIQILITCEHCGLSQLHEQLGENGTCRECKKQIRKGLF